jgi:hypothetical protein
VCSEHVSDLGESFDVESLAGPSNHIHAQLTLTIDDLTDTACRAKHRHQPTGRKSERFAVPPELSEVITY